MKQDSPFGVRLRKAFGGASNTEIASKTGYNLADLTKYTKKGVFPTGEKLVEISRITNYSIHWLLTGEGPETVAEVAEAASLDTRIDLDEREDLFIRRLAAAERKTTDQVAMELLSDALKRRGAELFGDYEKFSVGQLKDMLDVAVVKGENENGGSKRRNNVK